MAMLVITRGYRWCSWIFPHETSVSDGAPEVFPVSKRLEMRHVRRCVDLIRWLLAWRGTNMPWVWSVSVGFLPGLVNIHKAIENCHGNSGFTHSKWWFSISMLNYQRVHPEIHSCNDRWIYRFVQKFRVYFFHKNHFSGGILLLKNWVLGYLVLVQSFSRPSIVIFPLNSWLWVLKKLQRFTLWLFNIAMEKCLINQHEFEGLDRFLQESLGVFLAHKLQPPAKHRSVIILTGQWVEFLSLTKLTDVHDSWRRKSAKLSPFLVLCTVEALYIPAVRGLNGIKIA